MEFHFDLSKLPCKCYQNLMRKVALGFLKLQWTQAMLTVVLKCHEIFYLYFLAQKTLYLAKMV